MLNITVEAKCDSGFRHFKNIKVPEWTGWITIDEDGEIWGWRFHPVFGLTGWMADAIPCSDKNVEECGPINPGLSCTFSDWKEMIWQVKDLLAAQEQEPEPVVVGPYVGKKIRWIKAVRQATGAGLWISKWAVDCALAAGCQGTQEDFIKTVRFLLNGNGYRYFNLDDSSQDRNFNEALSALENGRDKDNLVDFALEFWGKDE